MTDDERKTTKGYRVDTEDLADAIHEVCDEIRGRSDQDKLAEQASVTWSALALFAIAERLERLVEVLEEVRAKGLPVFEGDSDPEGTAHDRFLGGT